MKAAVISGSIEPYQLSTVSEIPRPSIAPNQLLIKSHSFAINPTDWKHILAKSAKRGYIIGSDVSGIVEEVGDEVIGFKPGDHVSSVLHGNISFTMGAFGEYAIVNPRGTINYGVELNHSEDKQSRTVDSFEGAASVTLGLATVALSFSYSLGISYDKTENQDKFILIWGGATATGLLAVQIAKLVYGLQVITTASAKNHQFLKSLGADYTFDYKDSNVVDAIKQVGKNKIVYGLDTIAKPETFQQLYDATESTSKVYLDSLLGMDGRNIVVNPERQVHYGYTIVYLVFDKEYTTNGIKIESNKEMVEKYDEFWTKYLPKYIHEIKHSNLVILKPGLESVNEGLELSKQGKVSAEKVVFNL
ncbi:Uncharacterized protein JA1_004082 [Spathaspora sp. JA1]|nr:Uncharacterized protein JA1_004082 [Spathaspora sp. JA1]